MACRIRNFRLAAALVPLLAIPPGCSQHRIAASVEASPRRPKLLDVPPTDLPLPVPARAQHRRCALTLPSPQSEALVHGPAYLLGEYPGLLAITAEGVHELLPDLSQHAKVAALGPDGKLWINDSGQLYIVGLDQQVRRLPGRDSNLVEALKVGNGTHAWVVSRGSGWRGVEHFDIDRWIVVGVEDDFQGPIIDFELSDDAVWIASDAGLFRSTEPGQWELLDDLAPSWLGRYRGQLLARDERGLFVRADGGWRALDLQLDDGELVVSDRGIVARAAPDAVVELHSILGTGCSASSTSLPGSHVEALTADASGRVWARTDRALAVIEPDGRIAAEWPYGSLPGLTRAPNAVFVVGAGPDHLPPAEPIETRSVFGAVVNHEGERIADAVVELCSARPTFGVSCPAASVLGRASSDVHGRFQMTGVPPGDYWLGLELPPNTDACAGDILAQPSAFNLESICPARDEPCSVGFFHACAERPQPICTPVLPGP